MFAKSYVQQSIDAWSIPTLNLREELLNPNETFATKPYPILDKALVFRNAKELAELLQVYPEMSSHDIVKLISFRPERLMLHALIVLVNLKLKVADELKLQTIIYNYHEKLKANLHYHSMIESVYKKRQLLEKAVKSIMGNNLDEVPAVDPDYQSIILKKIAEIRSKIDDQFINFGKYVTNYNKEQALTALVIDNLYKELIVPDVFSFVEDLINQEIKIDPELAIKPADPNERVSFMIAGGQASGKGEAWEILNEELELDHLNLEDFLKLNTDYFKPLLLTPGSVNKYLYSQLAQPEATLMRMMIQEQLEQLVATGNAPHLFVDQVFLAQDKLNFSLGGRGVIALMISTKVETAIERSFTRGEEVFNNCGRFESTSGILAGHKGVAEHFFDEIFNYIGKKLSVIVFDNNVLLGEQPIEVMRLNLATSHPTAIISDVQKLIDFIKKLTINTEAHHKDEVYAADSDRMAKLFYKKFLNDLEHNGFKIQIKSHDITKSSELLFFAKELANATQSTTSASVKTYHV